MELCHLLSGIANFGNLTVLAASSRNLHLVFFCDGVVFSWNNPGLQTSLYRYRFEGGRNLARVPLRSKK